MNTQTKSESARYRRTFLVVLLLFTSALLVTLAVILFKAATVKPPPALESTTAFTAPPNESSRTTTAPRPDVIPEPSDVNQKWPSPAPVDDCVRRLDARNCRYNFTATVKTTGGGVYQLSKVQTLSRFPFPPKVKERFGRLMVMAWASTNGAVPSAPFAHFWFSRVARLQHVGTGLEITTVSGKQFDSEWGWISNSRHKRYGYENRDGHHETIVGLAGGQQLCLDSLEIDEMVFTTAQQEIDRFERDLESVLPSRRPAVFQFENRQVAADRFFRLDAGGEWYRTIFYHPGWPDGPEFTIWRDSGQASGDFWDRPQAAIFKTEAKRIQFGPAPDWIRTKAQLRDGKELIGYLVTHTESQRGAWQWEQGREGFWDSIVLITEEGLDVYAMFPGGPHFAEFAADVGALMSINFEDQPPGDATK